MIQELELSARDNRSIKLRVRHFLEYSALRMALAIARLLPLGLASDLFAKGCRIYSSKTRRHGRALANVALALPEKTPAEREAIVQAMWENVGRVIAESIHIDIFLAEPHRLDALDMSILDEYSQRRGLYIIAGMHTGNWEIGLLHTHRRGYGPAAFYRTISNPLVDRYIRASREKIYDGGMFAMRGGVRGGGTADTRGRQLAACLRKGVPIGILMDQYDPGGVVVPFFGHLIRVSRAPAQLALHFQAKLCVARTVRIGDQSRFWGEAEELELPNTGDREADIQALTATIMRRFESWIRQFPEQWLWSQAPFTASNGVYLGEIARRAI